MDTPEFKSEVRFHSQSALHHFITGPSQAPQKKKSNFNPYRKRQGVMAFLGVEELLAEALTPVEKKKELKDQPVTNGTLISLEPA